MGVPGWEGGGERKEDERGVKRMGKGQYED